MKPNKMASLYGTSSFLLIGLVVMFPYTLVNNNKSLVQNSLWITLVVCHCPARLDRVLVCQSSLRHYYRCIFIFSGGYRPVGRIYVYPCGNIGLCFYLPVGGGAAWSDGSLLTLSECGA